MFGWIPALCQNLGMGGGGTPATPTYGAGGRRQKAGRKLKIAKPPHVADSRQLVFEVGYAALALSLGKLNPIMAHVFPVDPAESIAIGANCCHTRFRLAGRGPIVFEGCEVDMDEWLMECEL